MANEGEGVAKADLRRKKAARYKSWVAKTKSTDSEESDKKLQSQISSGIGSSVAKGSADALAPTDTNVVAEPETAMKDRLRNNRRSRETGGRKSKLVTRLMGQKQSRASGGLESNKSEESIESGGIELELNARDSVDVLDDVVDEVIDDIVDKQMLLLGDESASDENDEAMSGAELEPVTVEPEPQSDNRRAGSRSRSRRRGGSRPEKVSTETKASAAEPAPTVKSKPTAPVAEPKNESKGKVRADGSRRRGSGTGRVTTETKPVVAAELALAELAFAVESEPAAALAGLKTDNKEKAPAARSRSGSRRRGSRPGRVETETKPCTAETKPTAANPAPKLLSDLLSSSKPVKAKQPVVEEPPEPSPKAKPSLAVSYAQRRQKVAAVKASKVAETKPKTDDVKEKTLETVVVAKKDEKPVVQKKLSRGGSLYQQATRFRTPTLMHSASNGSEGMAVEEDPPSPVAVESNGSGEKPFDEIGPTRDKSSQDAAVKTLETNVCAPQTTQRRAVEDVDDIPMISKALPSSSLANGDDIPMVTKALQSSSLVNVEAPAIDSAIQATVETMIVDGGEVVDDIANDVPIEQDSQSSQLGDALTIAIKRSHSAEEIEFTGEFREAIEESKQDGVYDTRSIHEHPPERGAIPDEDSNWDTSRQFFPTEEKKEDDYVSEAVDMFVGDVEVTDEGFGDVGIEIQDSARLGKIEPTASDNPAFVETWPEGMPDQITPEEPVAPIDLKDDEALLEGADEEAEQKLKARIEQYITRTPGDDSSVEVDADAGHDVEAQTIEDDEVDVEDDVEYVTHDAKLDQNEFAESPVEVSDVVPTARPPNFAKFEPSDAAAQAAVDGSNTLKSIESVLDGNPEMTDAALKQLDFASFETSSAAKALGSDAAPTDATESAIDGVLDISDSSDTSDLAGIGFAVSPKEAGSAGSVGKSKPTIVPLLAPPPEEKLKKWEEAKMRPFKHLAAAKMALSEKVAPTEITGTASSNSKIQAVVNVPSPPSVQSSDANISVDKPAESGDFLPDNNSLAEKVVQARSIAAELVQQRGTGRSAEGNGGPQPSVFATFLSGTEGPEEVEIPGTASSTIQSAVHVPSPPSVQSSAPGTSVDKPAECGDFLPDNTILAEKVAQASSIAAELIQQRGIGRSVEENHEPQPSVFGTVLCGSEDLRCTLEASQEMIGNSLKDILKADPVEETPGKIQGVAHAVGPIMPPEATDDLRLNGTDVQPAAVTIPSAQVDNLRLDGTGVQPTAKTIPAAPADKLLLCLDETGVQLNDKTIQSVDNPKTELGLVMDRTGADASNLLPRASTTPDPVSEGIPPQMGGLTTQPRVARNLYPPSPECSHRPVNSANGTSLQIDPSTGPHVPSESRALINVTVQSSNDSLQQQDEHESSNVIESLFDKHEVVRGIKTRKVVTEDMWLHALFALEGGDEANAGRIDKEEMLQSVFRNNNTLDMICAVVADKVNLALSTDSDTATLTSSGSSRLCVPFVTPDDSQRPEVVAANFCSFLQRVGRVSEIQSPFRDTNPFVMQIVASKMSGTDMLPTEETMQDLLFKEDGINAITISNYFYEVLATSSRKISGEPDVPDTALESSIKNVSHSTKSTIRKYHTPPVGTLSPFETTSWTAQSTIVIYLGFLGNPAAVCRLKMVNRFCNRIIAENEHTVMRDAVRLGGMSMNVRPAFWMWITLEKYGKGRCVVPAEDEPSGCVTIATNELANLAQEGRDGKWHHVIERDVARSFGNMPPHKTGARFRTDSIVRALVTYGRGRLIKRGVKGGGEAPPIPSITPNDGIKPKPRESTAPPPWEVGVEDEESKGSDQTPTDTVSDWGGVSPVASFASSVGDDGCGKRASKKPGSNDFDEQELVTFPSRDAAEELALSGNTLTNEVKATLQHQLDFILHALATQHIEVGYCQGMDYVVAHLLRVLSDTVKWQAVNHTLPRVIAGAGKVPKLQPTELVSVHEKEIEESFVVEETVFRVMDCLFTTYNMKHMYWPELRYLKICCRVFERLIQHKLPVLADHFAYHELNVGLFALGWFQTLFLYLPSMPTRTVCHMWDIWLVERSFKIFFRVGTAILFLSQPILLNMNLEGMMTYLNTFPDATVLKPDILIACALQIKVTNKMLEELEREVTGGL